MCKENNKIHVISCILLFFFTVSYAAKDSLVYRKRVFVAINGLANGVVDHVKKEQFTHAVITPECGLWINKKYVAGVSASFGFTAGTTTSRLNYLQQEYNLFCKYFPFEKNGWRWLGVHVQTGMANTCMLPSSQQDHFAANLSIGPAVNAGKRLAFTYTFPFYVWQQKNCPANLKLGNLGAHVRPHLGISYTFGK